MQFAIAMTAAPRDQPTVDQSLASLALAGFSSVTVFAEPDTRGVPRNCRMFKNKKTVGPWPNFKQCLTFLTHKYPYADCYIVFQDDIEIAAGLRAYLERKLWPADNTGIVSLYTPGPMASMNGQGWHEVADSRTLRTMYGALGYAMPRDVAQGLAQTKLGAGTLTKTDQWVGRYCQENALSYWHHTPSFIRHLAVSSSSIGRVVAPGREVYRQCAEFCDDASEL